MARKKLIIITNSYPSYNSKEKAFIAPEVDRLLENGFDIVYMPFKVGQRLEPLHDRESVIDLLSINRKYFLILFSVLYLLKIWFWVELKQNLTSVLKSNRCLANLIGYTVKAALVENTLKKIDISGVSVIYTYWCAGEAVGLANFKKNSGGNFLAISRMHGYDLYEDRDCNNGYIPYRRRVINELDFFIVLSKQAGSYLEKLYRGILYKVKIFPLGTGSVLEASPKEFQYDGVNFISCSYSSPVKRLDKIYSVISLLAKRNPDIDVRWKHIGCDISSVSLNLDDCPDNLTVIFLGRMCEKDIKSLYIESQNCFFINMSDYEGQPVSIMEAMSCAIPVIATNVGGVGELLGDSGILLEKYCDAFFTSISIENVLTRAETYRELSEAALQQQRKFYDVLKNHSDFALFLNELT